MKTYRIKCNNCKAEREVSIIENAGRHIIDWKEGEDTMFAKIVSGRKRLDGNWGWQCKCGNSDILTKQEQRVISNKTNPEAKEIQQIMNDLKVDKPKFKMVQL